MAVPFNIPEDHNEVEVIINQLQYLLTKLQAALRRSRRGNPQNQLSSHASTTRVRTNSSTRSRVREGSSVSSSASSSSSSSTTTPTTTTASSVPSANFPDILNNLAWLAAISQESIDSSSQQTTHIRPSRSRTPSESSCCEESKISEAALSHGNVQDWNQETDNEVEDEESSARTKNYSREGILSKIVPGPVSAPLWTAMICFVGWHIFRAR